MPVQNFITVHHIIVEIFQSGPKLWTDRQIYITFLEPYKNCHSKSMHICIALFMNELLLQFTVCMMKEADCKL